MSSGVWSQSDSNLIAIWHESVTSAPRASLIWNG